MIFGCRINSSKSTHTICLIFVLLFLAGCSSTTSNDRSETTDSRSKLLENVTSWAYQLQNINVAEIGESSFNLAVIDYSADGSDETAFTLAEITTMKGSGDNKKLVVAYMSIGEAEDYRYYFDAGASYMDQENPDWPGNYKVFYWEEEWQEIIESYVDRLIEAGFDGAYLDIIDAYEYYGAGGDSGLERESAADDMINFVIRIAGHARESDENFLIFPQNGADIINASNLFQDYLDAVDGIGAEDTFYYGDKDVDNDLDEQTAVIEAMDTFREAGKVVLSIEYLTDDTKIDDFYERALEKGYIPYATVRALDALTINSGHEPE